MTDPPAGLDRRARDVEPLLTCTAAELRGMQRRAGRQARRAARRSRDQPIWKARSPKAAAAARDHAIDGAWYRRLATLLEEVDTAHPSRPPASVQHTLTLGQIEREHQAATAEVDHALNQRRENT